jgi:hypothetical protein
MDATFHCIKEKFRLPSSDGAHSIVDDALPQAFADGPRLQPERFRRRPRAGRQEETKSFYLNRS